MTRISSSNYGITKRLERRQYGLPSRNHSLAVFTEARSESSVLFLCFVTVLEGDFHRLRLTKDSSDRCAALGLPGLIPRTRRPNPASVRGRARVRQRERMAREVFARA